MNEIYLERHYQVRGAESRHHLRWLPHPGHDHGLHQPPPVRVVQQQLQTGQATLSTGVCTLYLSPLVLLCIEVLDNKDVHQNALSCINKIE